MHKSNRFAIVYARGNVTRSHRLPADRSISSHGRPSIILSAHSFSHKRALGDRVERDILG